MICQPLHLKLPPDPWIFWLIAGFYITLAAGAGRARPSTSSGGAYGFRDQLGCNGVTTAKRELPAEFCAPRADCGRRLPHCGIPLGRAVPHYLRRLLGSLMPSRTNRNDRRSDVWQRLCPFWRRPLPEGSDPILAESIPYRATVLSMRAAKPYYQSSRWEAMTGPDRAVDWNEEEAVGHEGRARCIDGWCIPCLVI